MSSFRIDALAYHKGLRFATYDRNDVNSCAKGYSGAWWFHICFKSHLNGKYGDTRIEMGLRWYNFRNIIISTEMKIRRA
ncbi:hypothetical protein KUTeg_007307 [Tegillarca granosa]|uniref:Fibrinogen C-terminal domain-containing protein n=1 Tax=Tegillarca granosa TaxID=220873 RepID=A0ABQ9FCV4_TEGGR|nr:hypothetical protein KUTeg_007307 [Tegillarca granosa]